MPGFNKHNLLLRESRPCICGLAAYIRYCYSATIIKDNVCNCHEAKLVWDCSRLNNLYIFSLYRNPDFNDSLYHCMLFSISDIQQEDGWKATLIFVKDLNAHHQEWLG